jgi:hypothetical protein
MFCSPWATGNEVRTRPGAADLDATITDGAIHDASELLYGLSGRQFPGLCTATLRPAAKPSWTPYSEWLGYLAARGLQGYWSSSWGVCAGAAGYHDGCQSSRELYLPVYPVRSVENVTIDGVVLDASAYRVDDMRTLIRLDGEIWPLCQDLDLPLGQQGTFSLDVTYGQEPPSSGKNAAITFAAELAKARSDKPNKLPVRLQTITRQNVSMTVMDPQQFLAQGLTGIYEVDLFIRTFNPSRMVAPPIAWSPDIQSYRTTTTYPGG